MGVQSRPGAQAASEFLIGGIARLHIHAGPDCHLAAPTHTQLPACHKSCSSIDAAAGSCCVGISQLLLAPTVVSGSQCEL